MSSGVWGFGVVCGSSVGFLAIDPGYVHDFPFLSTSTLFNCADNSGVFTYHPAQVACSRYDAPQGGYTAAPTAAPTHAPTAQRTESPTAVSTESPTRGLTGSPTGSPTESPTAAPTGSPTAGATAAATEEGEEQAEDFLIDAGAAARSWRGAAAAGAIAAALLS